MDTPLSVPREALTPAATADDPSVVPESPVQGDTSRAIVTRRTSYADGHHIEQFSDWGAPADRLLEQKQTRATVRACIQQLPDNYRDVLVLRDIEELSTQEVAEMLSMTQTAVKVRLHRARQALSTLLRKEFAQPLVTS
jgi:RNA polymerase sigma factor (sigma-70 family)